MLFLKWPHFQMSIVVDEEEEEDFELDAPFVVSNPGPGMIER